MTCRDFEELGGAWLDGELDLVRGVELEAHARECAACTARLEADEALRDAVRAQPYYRRPAPVVHRQAMALRYAGMAAALAAAVYFLFFFYRPPMEHRVVEAHVRSLLANHLLDVPSSDRHTVKPWFAGKLDYSPDVKTPPGFELLGGRLDYLVDRPVAALVYRRRLHIVNVFVWPSGDRDRSPSMRSERGFQVMHWASGGMTWWAVSDLNGEELRALAGAGGR